MIVCDICGKKIVSDDTEMKNYVSLGGEIFYADVCNKCLTSIHNFIENKRGEKQ